MNKIFLIVLLFSSFVLSQTSTLTINSNHGRCYYKNMHDYSVEYDSSISHWDNGDTARLIPLPNAGYKFAYWVAGSDTFYRGVFDTTINSNTVVNAVFTTWTPPVGIPEPPFGIFESYRMYDTVENRNNSLTYSASDDGGYYTHYVDPSDPNSTDNNNIYGTKAVPRKTLPLTANVPEGSIVELGDSMFISSQYFFNVTGSKSKPIFLRGKKTFSKIYGGEFNLRGQYLIAENIDRDSLYLIVRASSTAVAENICVRQCKLYGSISVSYDAGYYAKHIIYYSNYVNSNAFNPEVGISGELDNHGGMTITFNSDSIWFIDNIITRAGGDATGAGHNVNYTAKNYYIGRNIMYSCGENAVDLKEVNTAIVSENTAFDFKGWSEGSDGTAIVLHQGPNYWPINVWIINNEIFECTGVAIQSGGVQNSPIYVIGNYIHDVFMGYTSWTSLADYFIKNTFINTQYGFRMIGSVVGAYTKSYNNIFHNCDTSLYISTPANYIGNNNIFYNDNDVYKFYYSGSTYDFLNYKSTSNKDNNSVNTQLSLDENYLNGRIIPNINSNAYNTGSGILYDSLCTVFYNTFGLSINVDRWGTVIPRNRKIDIGRSENKIGNSLNVINSNARRYK